jgi:hypothetical protein
VKPDPVDTDNLNGARFAYRTRSSLGLSASHVGAPLARMESSHQSLHQTQDASNLVPPELSEQKAHAVRSPSPTATVERRDRLGGLIHEYNIAA